MKKWARWNLLQKKWNAKLINKFIELEQIHISLLEKETLKGVESQQIGSFGNQKVHCGRLMLEEENETERSCVLKTNDLCVNSSTSQDVEQNFKFVQHPVMYLHSNTNN